MEFEAYAVGICFASVCTSLPLHEATECLNLENPTGIGDWRPSEAKTFRNGTPNPCDCPDHAGNKHYLFVC